MCRLLGNEYRTTGAQIPRNRQIIGFSRASSYVVRGTEVENALPDLGAQRGPSCMN
jgi:hypothetical protein